MMRDRTKSYFGNSKRIIRGLIAITAAFFMPTADVVAQQKDSIVQLPVFELTDTSVYRRMPVSVINAGSLEQIREVDLGEILRRQPNVSGIRRGGYALDPVVRGFRYSQISVFLDEGIHIEGGCPNRMDPVLAHIEPEQVNSLETCLAHANETDLAIINALMGGLSCRKAARQLFLSESTVYYRIDRLCQLSGAGDRNNFLALVKKYTSM